MDLETTPHGLSWRRTATIRAAACMCALSVAGCSGVQSALDPAGGDALRIYWLTVIMTVGGTLIFLLVTGLLLYAIFAPPQVLRTIRCACNITGFTGSGAPSIRLTRSSTAWRPSSEIGW